MKITVRILSIIALIISACWFINHPDFEPGLSVVVSISSLISTYIFGNNSREKSFQKQKISGGSTGIQSGGNVGINISNSSDKE
jgi:hypothetical protein